MAPREWVWPTGWANPDAPPYYYDRETAYSPTGLDGATTPTRWVGGTTSGAPADGDFEVGDFVVTQDGTIYICTVAGSPGTWVQAGSGSYAPSSGSRNYANRSAIDFAGTVNNYASAPHISSLHIPGDIGVRTRFTLDSWTPASDVTIFAKLNATGNQRAWRLSVTTTGKLAFVWSTDGTATVTANSTVGPTWQQGMAFAAELDVDNGSGGWTVRFYTSTDYNQSTDTGTWTQLGDPVTGAGVTSIFNASGTPLVVGGANAGATGQPTGGIEFCHLYSGLLSVGSPTRVASPGFTSARQPRFMDTEGNQWTINGSAWRWRAAGNV